MYCTTSELFLLKTYSNATGKRFSVLTIQKASCFTFFFFVDIDGPGFLTHTLEMFLVEDCRVEVMKECDVVE